MNTPETVLSAVPPASVVDRLSAPGRPVLMLGHVHPDADVLGTLLALGACLEAGGRRVVYAGPHPIPDTLSFLPGGDRWQVWTAAPETFDLIVLTDCPNDERTNGLLRGARGADSQVVNIDHHPDNRRYGTINWIDAGAAATGEMVFDLVGALGYRVSADMALNLFTAIHTDTGSFRYSNTTARTFQIAGRLVAAGADPALVSDRLYQRRSPTSLGMLGHLLSDVQLSDDGRVAWLAVPPGRASDEFMVAEDLVTYPRSIEGVDVAVLLRQEGDGTIKASLRGKGTVPVNGIARRFGGGGHDNAAGCTLPGPLEDATKTLLSAVRRVLDGKEP